MSDETGEIYFLGEIDLETKYRTNYVKIGRVGPGRSTEDRIKEHQTGNPRKIKDLKVIKAPREKDLETLLLHVFRKKCVGGEWFKFTAEDLEKAINFADEEAKELFELQDVVSKVRELGKIESRKEELPADKYSRDLACRFHFLKQRVKTITAALDDIRKEIYAIEGKKGELKEEDKITEMRVADPEPSFKKKDLESDAPDLYLQFCEIEKEVVAKPLSISKSIKNAVKDDERFFEEWPEESVQIEKLIRITSELISGKSESDEVLENLKINRDELEKFQGIYKHRAENCEWRLKHRCGSASGIREVCTWKRVSKEKKVFNEMKFKERHPKIYEGYIRPSPPKESVYYKNR